jgi:hypothetical protein
MKREEKWGGWSTVDACLRLVPDITMLVNDRFFGGAFSP